MSTIDDQISKLDALLGRADAPPTITAEVTYCRDGLIFQQGDVSVYGVICDGGSARGLLWIEDRWVSDEHREVIDAAEFRSRWPQTDRRNHTVRRLPFPDRRAS